VHGEIVRDSPIPLRAPVSKLGARAGQVEEVAERFSGGRKALGWKFERKPILAQNFV
jgi:hypothetical protein